MTIAIIGDGYGVLGTILKGLFPLVRIIFINLGRTLVFDVYYTQKYFEHIHKLHESHSFFKLENHDVNLFNFIGESDVIISIPYSSPVILAHTLKIPAFFYDPGNQLIFPDRYFPKSIVKVAKLENLVNEIRRKLPL